MKLKKITNEIYLGLNKKEIRHASNDKIFEYELLTIKSVNNKFINRNMLDTYESLTKIDDKFLTKKDDVIICSKPPYNVILVDDSYENILVPNNFIILRSSNVNVIFLYNYLNLLGSKMKNDEKDDNINITKYDVENIDVDLDNENIDKVASLSSRINKRQEAYSKLLDNDQELLEMIFVKEGIIYNE